ncbi:MAG TPA: hypothetical protein VH417_18495 [Vicinamibacterales bacterium]|jgi:hypothetical protein
MGRVRLAGIGVVAVVSTVAGAYLLLPAAVRLFVRSLMFIVNGSVWLAASLSSGTDGWTIATTVGRAAASALSTPQVTGFIAVLVLVGGIAVYGLQRLLGSEEESSR